MKRTVRYVLITAAALLMAMAIFPPFAYKVSRHKREVHWGIAWGNTHTQVIGNEPVDTVGVAYDVLALELIAIGAVVVGLLGTLNQDKWPVKEGVFPARIFGPWARRGWGILMGEPRISPKEANRKQREEQAIARANAEAQERASRIDDAALQILMAHPIEHHIQSAEDTLARRAWRVPEFLDLFKSALGIQRWNSPGFWKEVYRLDIEIMWDGERYASLHSWVPTAWVFDIDRLESVAKSTPEYGPLNAFPNLREMEYERMTPYERMEDERLNTIGDPVFLSPPLPIIPTDVVKHPFDPVRLAKLTAFTERIVQTSLQALPIHLHQMVHWHRGYAMGRIENGEGPEAVKDLALHISKLAVEAECDAEIVGGLNSKLKAIFNS